MPPYVPPGSAPNGPGAPRSSVAYCTLPRIAAPWLFRQPPAASPKSLVVVVLDNRSARRALSVEVVRRQPFGDRTPMPVPESARRRRGRTERIEPAAFERRRRVRPAALPRDDPDYRADGVRSIERALRPTHDLDSLDVGHRQVAEVEAAAERIGLHAVHEHERVVRFAAARKGACHRSAPAVGNDESVPAPRAARPPRSRPGAFRDHRG